LDNNKIITKRQPSVEGAVTNKDLDLMTAQLPWIICNGGWILLGLITMLIISSWFIRYPDIIKGVMRPCGMNKGKLFVPRADSGKVKIGQQVQIKFEHFPNAKLGFIIGIIDQISTMPIPRDSLLIEVSLPDGTRTNVNWEPTFRNNLLVEVEIIISDRSLSDRFFSQLRK